MVLHSQRGDSIRKRRPDVLLKLTELGHTLLAIFINLLVLIVHKKKKFLL